MSTPPRERTLEGLCLKATPLGEQDRLLLLLTEEEGCSSWPPAAPANRAAAWPLPEP